MKLLCISFLFVLFLSCSAGKKSMNDSIPPYQPESKELLDTIIRMDSLLFDAYNNCKPDVFASLVSEDIEFYHDRGGLDTSKTNLVAAIKNNICGKVRRELLSGSIEVYPIPGYGAVQMGAHRFYNLVEGGPPSHFSKFVHTWHRENGEWKLARVISLH